MRDWSSDVCSSDLDAVPIATFEAIYAAPCDGPKALVELLEAAVDDVGPACSRLAATHGRILTAELLPDLPAPIDRDPSIHKIYRTVGRIEWLSLDTQLLLSSILWTGRRRSCARRPRSDRKSVV